MRRRSLIYISLIYSICNFIVVLPANAETKCPDTWSDPGLNLTIDAKSSIDKDGFNSQIWSFKISKNYDVIQKLTSFGLTSKDYAYKYVMEISNSSNFNNPQPFEWHVPNGYDSSLMRAMDGGNPQVGEGTQVRVRNTVAVKDCTKEVTFMSNIAIFQNFLDENVPLDKLFKASRFNFQQESYIKENIEKTKSQLANLSLSAPSLPYMFSVDWISKMRNTVGGQPALLVAGLSPVGCVEPYGSTSGPPIDPPVFKFFKFPCKVGLFLQGGSYWKQIDSFQVEPIYVKSTPAATPTPAPSKTSGSTIDQSKSNENTAALNAQIADLVRKINLMQSQMTLLQKQLGKICATKPKPKYC